MKKHPCITFGSAHLRNFNIKNPMTILLYIENVYDEQELRDIVINNKYIGNRFASSYDKDYWNILQDEYKMIPITLDELMKSVINRPQILVRNRYKKRILLNDNDISDLIESLKNLQQSKAGSVCNVSLKREDDGYIDIRFKKIAAEPA